MLSESEKKVIAAIQKDIPVVERPFRVLAEQSDMTETEFLAVLNDLCQRGVIRRLGATLRHQKSGFEANAMTAWQVPENRIEEVGQKMASYREISHCYRRNPSPDWPYNLYTMIHARDEGSCIEIARKISLETAVNNYELLFSIREMKKTSMEYFSNDDDMESV
ncbi:MAG: Lrp/AsnC family transcriptional regulator [Desulfatirhabdiaceae bacterium]